MLEPVEQMEVNTLTASSPTTLYFYPYNNSARIVEFYMQYGSWGGDEDDLRKLLGDAASQVEIPDIVNGAPGIAWHEGLFLSFGTTAGCGARQGVEGAENSRARQTRMPGSV